MILFVLLLEQHWLLLYRLCKLFNVVTNAVRVLIDAAIAFKPLCMAEASFTIGCIAFDILSRWVSIDWASFSLSLSCEANSMPPLMLQYVLNASFKVDHNSLSTSGSWRLFPVCLLLFSIYAFHHSILRQNPHAIQTAKCEKSNRLS